MLSSVSARGSQVRSAVGFLTLQELLASVLLEQCFMRNWSLKIVHQEIKDRSDLFFRVPRELSEGVVLAKVSQSLAIIDDVSRHTHPPRSKMIRERYMAAAATWLCRYSRKR